MPIRSLRIDTDHVSLLTHFKRTNFRVEADRPSSVDGSHLERFVAPHDGRIGLRVLVCGSGQIHDTNHVQKATYGASVSAKADGDAELNHLWKRTARDASPAI